MTINPTLLPQDYAVRVRQCLQQGQFAAAQKLAIEGVTKYPENSLLGDQLFLLDPRWTLPVNSGRFLLRVPMETDYPFFLKCFANSEFMNQYHRLLPRQRGGDAIRRSLRNSDFSVAKVRSIHWLFESSQAGAEAAQTPIGLCSLVDIQVAHRRAELLIGMPDPRHRGQIMTAVATLLVYDFAFNRMGLRKLTSIVLADNLMSQRSTLAGGFTQEGYRRQHLRDPVTGDWVDTYENGFLVEDFRQNIRVARASSRLLGRDITRVAPVACTPSMVSGQE